MKKFAKFLLGLAILLLGAGIAIVLFLTKPEPKKESAKKDPPLVEVKPIVFETVRFDLPSQGLIEPRRKTAIAAEVGGKVIGVSKKFDAGGDFVEGETLLEIDPADYESAIIQAEASHEEAELALATEKAKAEQALRDWKQLGRKGEPSELTLREPQLKSAEARVKAAVAAIEKAKRDLQRTEVRASFAGRIERIHTEVGAYLNPGQMIADFYTTEPYEIRLPLSLDDWTYVQRTGSGEPTGEVVIRASAGGKNFSWPGTMVRSEGQIERESRSIYLVAEIDDAGQNSENLIQPGLFIQADIAGKPVPDVAKIDEEAFYDLERIVVVDSEKKLRLRKVDVIRRQGDVVLISRSDADGKGIREGDQLCLTELAILDELTDPTKEIEVRVQEIPEEGRMLTGDAALKP